jgi:hypothetical protein
MDECACKARGSSSSAKNQASSASKRSDLVINLAM